MNMNQNETRERELGVAIRRGGHPTTRAPHAFTLTELLVVIAIIGILAGLITGAAVGAMKAAQRASILLEIEQISGAVEEFKNEYGAYPPNGMQVSGLTISENDFVRMFRKAFPRSSEPSGLILALAGSVNPSSLQGSPTELAGGMTSAEAIFFWLGGFSKDPQFPISGPGGPSFDISLATGEVLEERNLRYEFDLGRLEPRNENGIFHAESIGGKGRVVEYDSPLSTGGPRRQINLWQYPPSKSGQPFVYFDSSRHDPDEYDLNLAGTPPGQTVFIHAIKKLREGFDTSATPLASDFVYANNKKFQIMHAGIDDEWGDFRQMSPSEVVSAGGQLIDVLTFPEGPFTGDIADTLTNFTTGTLEDAQE